MKNKKSLIATLIAFLTIGFAAVATTLIINGTVTIAENKSDFDVYFSKAYENGFEKNSLITSKTTIVFDTLLTSVGESYILDYDVTNGSSNYDSEITLTCSESNSYFIVKNVFNDKDPLKAKETRSGRLTITLMSPVVDSVTESVTLTIENSAIERDTYVAKDPEYESVDHLRVSEDFSDAVQFKTIEQLVNDFTIEELNSMTETELTSNMYYMPKFLGHDLDRRTVEIITLKDNNTVPENAIESWDVSEKQNGSIMAYTLDEDSNNMNELYIGGNGGVVPNSDSSFLFSYFYNLKEVREIENLNTRFVSNAEGLFGYDMNLTNLDVSNFNTSNMTNMWGMFMGCQNIKRLNVSSFDTKNVTNMRAMFSDCRSLVELDASQFETSNVTDMRAMFLDCRNLVELDLSNFETSNVVDMRAMFRNCEGLIELTISTFDTSKVKNMSSMFEYCKSLKSLDLSPFETSNVTDMSFMFYGCESLESLDVSYFDTSSVTNMRVMFGECESLKSLDVLNFNTSNVTDMSNMFWRCINLTTLDVGNFDTSKVRNMWYMFAGKSQEVHMSLTEIKGLENFDTSSATNIGGMFYSCGNMTSIDVSHFNTKNVQRFYDLFCNCFKLEFVDVSNFDTSSATDMGFMFDDCRSLKEIRGIENFNTSKVINMEVMFQGCEKLTNIDLSNFDTSNVEEAKGMFAGCKNMTTTITIRGTKCTSFKEEGKIYHNMFRDAAITPGTQITVNYTADASDLVDQMIATKSANSNVVKGSVVA